MENKEIYNNESELAKLRPISPTHFRGKILAGVSNQQQIKQPQDLQKCHTDTL